MTRPRSVASPGTRRRPLPTLGAAPAGGSVALAASYETCRELHRRHGTTYYVAARLLPAASRRHVHALYGFCRHADEIVDDLGPAPVERRAAALDDLDARLRSDLAAGRSDHPVLAALVATVSELGIDHACLARFLRSMRMDLTVRRYDTWDDLCHYMDGSAAVIGEMMVPVLGAVDRTEAVAPARALGLAFQLTNFLRDVDEDLGRDRVYLPQEDLRRFGADPRCRRAGREWRALMAFEIARARELYRVADAGIEALPPRSRACVRTARVLYARILEVIEARNYDVWSDRARVPGAEKLWVAARSLAGTIGARKP
jgi:phytoene synthase